MSRVVTLCVLFVGILGFSMLRGQEPAGIAPSPPVPDRATLEKQFTDMLSGATLIGHFTNRERGKDQPLKEEKYTISKVSKIRDDLWLFQARIQYGNHDATVPLPLEVKWAGDTPMITMTDFPVPGFGKFTCRVLFFRDEYAGTWDGGDHGGHLFGRIVRESKGQ